MGEPRIVDLFEVKSRYARSVHLERDFLDTSALTGYVVTPQAKSHLHRLADGLQPSSSQRAWRITGDYGSGKSSFALALAHVLSARRQDLPDEVRDVIDFKSAGIARPQLLPVLVTGSREPLSLAILRSVKRSLEATIHGGSPPNVLRRIRAIVQPDAGMPADEDVVRILEDVCEHVQQAKKATGVLILLDELGKFLEFAALHPERQDVYLLQRLAESASRSGKAPIFLVGILHQGFNAYAEHLSQAAQREWEKIAGRFEELLFNQPLDQTAALVSQALSIREKALPRSFADQAAAAMAATLDLGWYGPSASRAGLVATAKRLFPLHPSVLPVLVRLLNRFGQNERSLFSFLLSSEPFGLQSFADRLVTSSDFYRLDNLYDYARATFGHRLSVQSYRSHWNQIESVVESFASDDKLELRVLKTIAILNLLDAEDLLASDEAIALAVAGNDATHRSQVKKVISRLQKQRQVLYHRGAAGGFCLWPHTSVNLDKARDLADRTLGTPQKIGPMIQAHLETRPIVARRHYIETGNLRHFEIEYRSVDASPILSGTSHADGRILVYLCETPEERVQALKLAASSVFREHPEVLVAVPRPLQTLTGLVQEAERWRWVAEHIPALNHDPYAAEEVSRQIAASRLVLEKRLQSVLGLRQFAGDSEMDWFTRGKPIKVGNGRQLLTQLSDICDKVYDQAPRIANELVNRRQLSSAAAAARMRLIERAFTHAAESHLGMDPQKKPPEMSIYLSVLARSKVHRQIDGLYGFAEPPADDPCNLRPSLTRVMDVLRDRKDGKVPISELFEDLQRPPYGVREGIAPLLLAILAIMYEHELAFFEGGGFIRQLTGEEFLRILKAPASFEVQYCQIAGVRSVLFEQLLRVLLPKRPERAKPDVLDVVRPLCGFAAQLPYFAQKSLRLSPTARGVRTVLTSAREPAPLLFTDLPRACGSPPFAATGDIDRDEVVKFVATLKLALDELKSAYPQLLQSLRERLSSAFDRSDSNIRVSLQAAAESLLVAVTEPQLKSFCLRLVDGTSSETEWLESLGGLLTAKPPSKWTDGDNDRFGEELDRTVRRFRHVESVLFSRGNAKPVSAFRVAVTQPDGTEVERVLQVSAEDQPAVAELEAKIRSLLHEKTQRVGVAAISQIIWSVLAAGEGQTKL